MDVEIAQARLTEVAVVADILREAAAWAERAHGKLWSDAELAPASIRNEVAAGQFYIARRAGDIAGTLRFQLEDAEFWPESVGEAAAYVHRLAVRRCFAGRGLAASMLSWAANEARARGLSFLRLDADFARYALRAFYERCGFRPHSERRVGPYYVMRYELRLQSAG